MTEEFPNVFILTIPFFLMIIIMMIRKDRTKLPPGPKRLPIIGNLHQLLGNGSLPYRSLDKLSQKFGPLMFLQLGSLPTLVVSSADVAKEIFTTHDQIFSERSITYAGKKLSYNCQNLSFAPYGEYWRQMRKLLVVELLSMKRVQSFRAVREQEVEFMINFISSNSHDLINLNELTLLLANRVVCRVAFGPSEWWEGRFGKKNVHEILHETQSLVGEVNIAQYFPWLGWLNKLNGFDSRLEKDFRELDEFYNTIIDKHLDSKRSREGHDDQEDLVDVLLRVQETASSTSSINNDQIKGILTDIFIAGTDTASATLVWTMTELIKNPPVMQKIQKEVREAAKGKTKVSEEDLPKLEYLKSVIKESLRLHPPAPLLIPRETMENCTIRGYEIPAKTTVLINATSICMDKEYWVNPNEFNPERFLNSSVDFKGQNFEFIPFGVGRRACPGIPFATLLVDLALANLLLRFDWSLPQGMRVEDVDMGETLGIVMTKKHPLCLLASEC